MLMVTERAQPRRIDLPDMSADMIASRRFSQSWRGYDQEEVKQFLAEVAGQVRAWKERYETAEAARREAEQRAAHPQIDEATLTSALGEETTAILRSAHSAAAEIVSKAEANAQQLVSEAQARAGEIVERAESLLAERTAEAEAVAAKIVEDARSEADHLRSEAHQQHEEMVHSAREQSDKILADLARKRRLATVQIEQLRAGREKLLEAYKAVRRTLDEVTAELQRADAEARAASQAVARQHVGEAGEDPTYPGEEPQVSVEPGDAMTARPASAAQPAGATVLRAPKVAQVAGEWSGLPAGQNEPVVARAAEFESVRIVREPAGQGPHAQSKGAPEPGSPGPVVQTGQLASEHSSGRPGEAGLAEEQTAEAGDEAPSEEAPIPWALSDKSAGASGAAEAQDESPPAIDQAAWPEAHAEAEAQAQTGGPSKAAEEVQDLFARIRASRAAAASNARAALEQPGGEGEAPTPPMGTPVASNEPGFFAQRDEVFNRLESSLARKLKRALQDEQNDLLDRLRNVKGPPASAKILPSADEHPDRFVDASKPLLEEAVQAGLSASNQMFGLAADTKLDAGTVENLAEELGRAVAEPLRRRLEEALHVDGEPAEVADAIGAAYREWKTQRIEETARDQLAAAWARGAYLAVPEQTLLCWVVDPSEGPCPDCEDNALARPQPKGEHWPTGQLHPPAHPGCRCALAPAGQVEALAVPAGVTGRGRKVRRSGRAG